MEKKPKTPKLSHKTSSSTYVFGNFVTMEKLNVFELKCELRKRNLSAVGTKAVLLERLRSVVGDNFDFGALASGVSGQAGVRGSQALVGGSQALSGGAQALSGGAQALVGGEQALASGAQVLAGDSQSGVGAQARVGGVQAGDVGLDKLVLPEDSVSQTSASKTTSSMRRRD